VKELNSKGDAAFVAEAGDKAPVEPAAKRPVCGGTRVGSACLLPLPLCKPMALAVVLKTATS
jgi:hypothetical protein